MPPSMPPVIRPLDRPAHGALEQNRNNVNSDNNDKSGNINSGTIDDHHPNNNNKNNNNNFNNSNINSDSDMNSSYTTFNTNYNLNSSNNLNSSQNFSLNSQIFSDPNGSQQTLSFSENENFLLDGKSNLSNQTLQSLLENEISEFHSADLRTSFNSPPRSHAASASASASTNVIYCDLSYENSKLVSNITNAPNNRKNNDQKNVLKSHRPSHSYEISNYKVSKIRNKTRSREGRTGLQKTAFFNTPNDRFMESSL